MMLHIHKTLDNTFVISLEVKNQDRTVLTFCGEFTKVSDSTDKASDNTLAINVPTLGDDEMTK